MELFSLTDEAVVGAVLNGGAIGGDVESSAEGFKEVSVGGGLCLKLNVKRHRITDLHFIIVGILG